MADVVLVRMPYSDITQPSIALGVLKACLNEAGIPSYVISANLAFSERIGPVLQEMLFQAYSYSLIGEWTFASAAFPDHKFEGEDDYLKKSVALFALARDYYWRELHIRNPYIDLYGLLRDVRQQANVFVDDMVEEVLGHSPRIVGCTSTFQQHLASLALLRRIKAKRPDIVTMIGGANCEGNMGAATFKRFPWIDYVVSGDADSIFGSLCTNILDAENGAVSAERLTSGVFGPPHRNGHAHVVDQALGSRKAATPDNVVQLMDGPSRKFLSGSAPDQAPASQVADFNDSPIPDYDDYFEYLQRTKLGEFIKPSVPFQMARGCWWGEKHQCTFCGISQSAMKFRSKTPERVISELRTLKSRYNIKTFQSVDYILDNRYFSTVIPMLREIDGSFRFEVKANLNSDKLKTLVDSHVFEIQPGIESLHDEMLKLIDKGTTALINTRLLRDGMTHHMSVYWNLLHHIPREKDEWYLEMAELFPLIHHLQPPYAYARISIHRFSVYWNEADDYGMRLVPAFGYKSIYPFSPDELMDHAYFFENAIPNHEYFGTTASGRPGLEAVFRELKNWHQAWGKRGREGKSRPKLSFEDLGDRGIVTDTREIATQETHVLTGVEYEVYKACYDGANETALVRKVTRPDGQEMAWEDLAPAVDKLVHHKLLAKLSGKYLSLAAESTVNALLCESLTDDAHRPTNAIFKADNALRDQTLAKRWNKSPGELSLTESFVTHYRRRPAAKALSEL